MVKVTVLHIKSLNFLEKHQKWWNFHGYVVNNPPLSNHNNPRNLQQDPPNGPLNLNLIALAPYLGVRWQGPI